jgi:hypothetical protein
MIPQNDPLDFPKTQFTIVNFCSERRGDYQPRYTNAEPLLKRSLATREETLGPDHPDIALPLNNLAGLYAREGRYADTERLYKRSL